nr:hypothetical protein [Roseburia sp. AF25-25LB]
MLSKKIKQAMAGSSAIRAMFMEGKEMAARYGAENVYDFSLAIRLHRHRKKLRQQFMIFWIKKTRLWCMDIWQMQAMRK